MIETSRKGFLDSFFTIMISLLVILSIFSSGTVLSEETEDRIEILVHKRGTDFEDIFVKREDSIIEDYDGFVLMETTKENKLALKREGFALEPIEDTYQVGLNYHSFSTDGSLPEIPERLKIESYAEQEKGAYIVQFIGPIKTEWKEELREMGVVLHEFRHRFNFIVEMDPEKKDYVEELDFVNWVGIYQPAYKFDQELLERQEAVNIEVSVFEGYDPKCLLDEIHKFSGSGFFLRRDILKGQVRSDKIELLANLPQVKSIGEKTQEYHLYNAESTWIGETNERYYRKLTEEGITGRDELITVMDSELYMEDDFFGEGVHEAWEDLEGTPIGDDHRKVQAWYVPGDSNAKLEYGVYHGTHVTGTVLGASPPYEEYSNHDGNALEARLIFQDIDNEVMGLNPPSDMYNMGWGDAYDMGSRVHTNSWGGGDGYGGLGLEADEFLWDHKDFNVLFAMANSGPDPNTLSQQAEGKNVISVGSVTNYPNQDDVSSFSSRGYADDGRIKPTVMHVGEGVWSAERSDDGYQSLSGTSMATPGIAGQVGQIRQYYEDGWYLNGTYNEDAGFNPSNALVRATLINGAVEISGDGAYHNEAMFPNNDQGYGRTKLDRALHIQGDERMLKVFDSENENTALDTGESWSMEFDIDDPSQELEVTLAWTDAPGSSGSDEDNPAIVNDLDLEMETPGGTRYVGNAFTGYDPGYSEADPPDNAWSGLRDGEHDGLNVEEDILLLPDYNGVEEGTYELTVTGHNIPEGSQPFAVMITGGLASSETNDPPSIELTRPAGGETWYAGEEEDIMWETDSGDGSIEGIDLDYSSDGGDSWSSLDQGIQDKGSYTWNVPEQTTEEAMIRAVVNDENGLSDQDISDLFSIGVVSGPLQPTSPQPEDGSVGISTDPELSVYVEHEDGAPIDVSFCDASDDSLITELKEVPSGTRASMDWSDLDHGTAYEWYVEADDGEYSNVSDSWSFTTIEERALTIDISGEGSTDPGKGTHTYEHGEEVTIEAVSTNDWYFVEWTGDVSSTDERVIITVDEDKEVMAWFEQHTYTLDAVIEGGGTVEIDPEQKNYESGTEVTLTAEADEGWEFVEWKGDHQGTEQETIILMDEDKSITAYFEVKEYDFTIEIEGEGKTHPEKGTHTFEYGKDVMLEAFPDEGWYFSHWKGNGIDGEGSDVINITVEDDKEVTAHFERKEIEEHTLEIDITGEGLVKVEDENVSLPYKEEYENGTTVSLEAIAVEGWSFKRWTGDHESDKEKITVLIEDETRITAHLEKLGAAQFEVEIHSYDVREDDDQETLVSVEYSLENTGDVEDTQEIALYVEGDKEEKTELTLGADEKRNEEFTVEVEEEICEIEIVSEDDEETDIVVIEEMLTEDEEEEDKTPSFTFLLLLLGVVLSTSFYYIKKRLN
ncbi:MAG: InlB B-repeat-containing protein [Candidatus Natronoplasma sp.]